jgi:Tfp pilus assembly protein PilO
VNRRLALIAGGVAAAMLALWFLFLWKPQTADINDARERQEAAAAANNQLELEAARLRAADENKTELVADQERLRVAVPDDAQLAQFILDANDAASASGVDFLSVAPAAPVADVDMTGPTSVLLSINVDGGYFQVLDYMNRLDAMDRIVVIDNLSLAPSGEGKDVRLSVSISARMFTTAVPAPTDGSVAVVPEAGSEAPSDGSSTVPEPAPSEGTVLGDSATTTKEAQ